MSDQQDPMREALREVSKWLNEQPNRPIDRQAVAVLCAALATPTASGDMVSVPRELIRSALAHLEFIERETVHDARDLRQRLSAANESVQAQPVAGTDAFKAYLRDCDIHAIKPDVAGAFHWAWQHALARPASTQQVPMDEALMRQALEQLECSPSYSLARADTIAALRQRLKIGGAG